MKMTMGSSYDDTYAQSKNEMMLSSHRAGSFIDEFGVDTGVRPLNLPGPSPERLAEIQAQFRAANKAVAASNRKASLILCGDWLLTPAEKEERRLLLEQLDREAER